MSSCTNSVHRTCSSHQAAGRQWSVQYMSLWSLPPLPPPQTHTHVSENILKIKLFFICFSSRRRRKKKKFLFVQVRHWPWFRSGRETARRGTAHADVNWTQITVSSLVLLLAAASRGLHCGSSAPNRYPAPPLWSPWSWHRDPSLLQVKILISRI